MSIIQGTADSETLDGTAEADEMFGLFGDDILRGSAGADRLDGGPGSDTADYRLSASSVSILTFASSGAGGDADGDLFVSIENIIGSSFGDTIVVNDLDNTVDGHSGNDILAGFGGADTLLGGDGDDLLDGGAGVDILLGGAGFDEASYGTSTSGIAVDLGLGTGSAGDALGDVLDSIEDVTGSNFADQVTGSSSANQLNGRDGADTLKGLGGNDSLAGGAGADILDGGDGSDTAEYAGPAAVSVSLAAGTASGGDAEGDTLTGFENLSGSFFADVLEGNDAANRLDGNAGGDTLRGLGGSDTLDGGAQDDFLFGGTGSDLYIVTAGDDVTELAGEGTADRVAARESFVLDADDDIEILSTADTKGTTAIDLTGNQLKQEILGNAGDNILNSGGGAADVMKGLGGNDTYRVFNAGDVVIESQGNGSDKVVATVDYRLGAGVHVEILQTNGSTGTSAIDLTGNEFAQQIIGNAGANRIEGKGGNDTLRGGSGADTFVFASTLGAANVDKILDFSVPADRMLLSDAIFTALDTGTLSSAAFRANNTGLAQDSSDHIIYERDSGKLFYDADGLGGSAGIHFATLTVGLALTNADFSVA